MTEHFIPLGEHRSLKFVAKDGKIAIFDLRWERITPGHPQMHWVGAQLPVTVFDTREAQALADFLVAAV